MKRCALLLTLVLLLSAIAGAQPAPGSYFVQIESNDWQKDIREFSDNGYDIAWANPASRLIDLVVSRTVATIASEIFIACVNACRHPH